MRAVKLVLIFLFIAKQFAATAQDTSCHAYFTYVYDPQFSQPEQPIYLFSDSSTGEDSSTTYLWSFGTGDFSSNKNPSYTYDIDDSSTIQVCFTIHDADNGCTSKYCDSIHLDDLCVGAYYTYLQHADTFTYTAHICGDWDSIKWNFGDGTTADSLDTIVHVYNTGIDSFYVCMRVYIGSLCQYNYRCKAVNCQELYLNPTGINNVALPDEHIAIYPDPANEYIIIDASQTGGATQFAITDITGKILMTTPLDNAMQHIDISNLATGIYFVQIINAAKQSVIKRFIKQ